MALSILSGLAAFYGQRAQQRNDDKKLKILFIGNSMSQDAVSYVPMILKNVAPELKFKIYDWYSGGYTAKDHIQDWKNGKTAETLSVADNSAQWKNYHSSDFLSEKFSHAFKRSFSRISTFFSKETQDKQPLNNNNNNQTTQIVPTQESNSDKWKNYYISGVLFSGLSNLLKTEKFDIIVVQEYFNGMNGNYTKEDFNAFKEMVKYVKDSAPYSFYLAELFHPPRRNINPSNGKLIMDEIYKFSQKSTEKILKETDVDSLIPAGIALYDACSTDLKNLGDTKLLAADNLHAQEGLPCMIMAYVTTQWILDKLGTNKTILGDKTRITSENYPKIKVPGANFGSGIVEGTEEQYLLAQKLALEAIKKGKEFEKSAKKLHQDEKRFMDIKARMLEK